MRTTGAYARRRASAVLGAALALVVASGCVADPPPPTVVGDDRTDGTAVSLTDGGILLALDRVEAGFNPHLLADQGADTDLVASLLLPSAFVPGVDGEPVLNRDLLLSAAPLPDAPETIRYTIDQQAQWSDGVPVAAEDFEYLWRQMTGQPGVVDPAGYEQIVDVRSGAGGKVVDVVFESVPAHWRSLFQHMLPAHILKGAPDGFEGSMEALPVMSAGPFMIRAADIGRGEIEFVRNDRYWAGAPGIEQIVVRRATGPGQLGAALRDGPGSMALVSATPVATDVSETVPGVTSTRLASTAQLELTFNSVAPTVSDPTVRRAVAAALDPQVVGRIVTGEARPEVSSFPFPAGTAVATTADPALTDRALTGTGFALTGTRWQRDDVPLSLTLGVEATDDRAVTAAYTVADQLRGAGIGARVWELGSTDLYADALPHGLVDAVVGWQRADGQPELAAVSRFACAPTAPRPGSGASTSSSGAAAGSEKATTTPARPRTTVPSLSPPEPDTGRSRQRRTTDTTVSAGATSTAPTSPPRTIGRDATARASDVSGICDPVLDRALGVNGGDTSSPTTTPDLVAAGERVADLALRVPLVRPTLLLATDGVDVSGSGTDPDGGAQATRPVTDVFDTAPTWRRTG
ncbi:ABC transporter family substrate-binding protein [Dietzia cinnamea]|uniref:ABC transporter family substrate-binding protein n=1 Tax=Dietzia cinnamea TaxID=321318 RepID=UPI0021A44EB5|nr:ABC transporter family substrate-binding protein [Dietzia cinnamea]MCT2059010.1 ABC transporter family substrate-binding protein [Dietzia cinnamea]MCT2120260.1 ABC transporter family substrate-binding protein [Dietzia cinnamea]MCT2144878.1 ABC transporter family substrate-binding protein [Dietzia cinnamea]MCT2304445.1 ABC transporter family substrate-binding protein [Dietzia cinnamea]